MRKSLLSMFVVATCFCNALTPPPGGAPQDSPRVAPVSYVLRRRNAVLPPGVAPLAPPVRPVPVAPVVPIPHVEGGSPLPDSLDELFG